MEAIEKTRSKAGPPHEAIFMTIPYLPLQELLVMSEVCRELRDAVKKDVLPWLDLVVDMPLSLRFSDEIFMEIASKAQGRLRSLVLINCTKISDAGLQRILEKNPLITKLHLPGCTGLTPQGITRAVNTLSQHPNTLKSLQIKGIYNLNKHHLQTLTSTIHNLLIDVDACPKCNEVRTVFECPRKEKCKHDGDCRGCRFCVARCKECGGCGDKDGDGMEEGVCGDVVCWECWVRLLKCKYCNKACCEMEWYCLGESVGFLCDACHMGMRMFYNH